MSENVNRLIENEGMKEEEKKDLECVPSQSSEKENL